MGNDENNNTNEKKNENNQVNQYKSDKNVINERRKCPYCAYLYLYSNEREINYYNKHVNSCTKRKPTVNYKLPTQQKINNNIQINTNNFIYIKNNFQNKPINVNKNFKNNNNNYKIQNANNINKNLNTNKNYNNNNNNNFNNTYQKNVVVQTEAIFERRKSRITSGE